MDRVLELHVNRAHLPPKYRTSERRKLFTSSKGVVAEVKVTVGPGGKPRYKVLRTLTEIPPVAAEPPKQKLTLVQN